MRLCRLGLSLASPVTSADGTDHVSPRRLRLLRLTLSRSVWFTNRFTKQATDLQFPPPSRPSVAVVRHRVRARQATCLAAWLDVGHVPLVVLEAGCHVPDPHHRCRACTGAPTGAVVIALPWAPSPPNPDCCREHSYGGFGGGHTPFHLHASCRQPDLHNLHYQLGNLCRPGLSHGLTCGAECPRVTVRDRSSPGLMAR